MPSTSLFQGIMQPNISGQNTSGPPADHMDFSIGNTINLYYPPIFILIGGTGNFLSYIVYRVKSLSKKSLPLFMRALAMTDNIVLLCVSFSRWLHTNFTSKFADELDNKRICIAFTFLGHVFMNWSHYLIVAVTLTRLIAVALPLTPKISTDKARKFVVCIGLFSILKNLHCIWCADFEYDPGTHLMLCGMQYNHSKSINVFLQWLDAVMSCFAPFMIILFGNICIIRKLQKKRRSTTQRALFLCLPRKVRNIRQRQENYMTVMAVIVSFVFLFLVGPLSMYHLYAVHTGARNDAYTRAVLFSWYNICVNMRYTNSAVNFYLYALIGRDCQKGLRRLLRKKRTVRPYKCPSDMYRAGMISNTPSVSSGISPYLITTTF